MYIDGAPCTSLDATKHNLDHEMAPLHFTLNGENPDPKQRKVPLHGQNQTMALIKHLCLEAGQQTLLLGEAQ